MTKFCNRCKTDKDVSAFSRYKAKSGNMLLRPWCKACYVDYQRERLKDPTKKSAQHDYNAKAWASMTPEQRDEWNIRRRLYLEPRKPSENAKARKRRAANPEIGKKQAKKKMERFHSDPNFQIRENIRTRLRQAVVHGQKAGSAVEDLGCPVPAFREYLSSKFKTGMTWENYGHGDGKWHIDHIVPLRYFNLTDRQHFILACYYLNMQPLWSHENFSKNDTYPTFPWHDQA